MSEELQPTGVEELEAAAPHEMDVDQSQAENEHVQEAQTVPLSALQSERESRQRMEEELKMIKDHLSLMQTSQRQQQTQPKSEIDGMDDSDVLTLGDFKKILSSREKEYQMSIEDLRMSQKYPDYQEVLQKYLPEVLKANPALRRSLEINPDHEVAYQLAKMSPQYLEATKKQKKHMDAERIVKNSQQAGSLSSMGGSTPVSQAKRYKDMTDSEFRKLMNTNLGVI